MKHLNSADTFIGSKTEGGSELVLYNSGDTLCSVGLKGSGRFINVNGAQTGLVPAQPGHGSNHRCRSLHSSEEVGSTPQLLTAETRYLIKGFHRVHWLSSPDL